MTARTDATVPKARGETQACTTVLKGHARLEGEEQMILYHIITIIIESLERELEFVLYLYVWGFG